jgi:hypothetical protein
MKISTATRQGRKKVQPLGSHRNPFQLSNLHVPNDDCVVHNRCNRKSVRIRKEMVPIILILITNKGHSPLKVVLSK